MASDVTRVRSNVQALSILQAMRKVNMQAGIHQLRLATGRRINSAGDDPAGLTIATKLDARQRILSQIYNNLGEAKNILSVAEGGLSQINDILVDMGTKIERAASDSIGTSERQAISAQLVQLVSEINSIANETDFNGIKLLSGQVTFTFQTNERNQTVFSSTTYTVSSMLMTSMSALSSASVINSTNYLTYMSEVEAARSTVLSGLSTIGSLIGRFSIKEEVIQVGQINTEAAYSRIMNADMAEEQLNLVKFQILQQSTTAMLAQANLNGQSILSLLGG
jgi:flagellin